MRGGGRAESRVARASVEVVRAALSAGCTRRSSISTAGHEKEVLLGNTFAFAVHARPALPTCPQARRQPKNS